MTEPAVLEGFDDLFGPPPVAVVEAAIAAVEVPEVEAIEQTVLPGFPADPVPHVPPPEPEAESEPAASLASGFDASQQVVDLFGEVQRPTFRNILAAKFLQPPFSVLSAREGEWQERKRRWIGMGLRSEVGRGSNLLKMSDTILAAQNGDNPNQRAPKEFHSQPGGAPSKNSCWMTRDADGYQSIKERSKYGRAFDTEGTMPWATGHDKATATGTSIFDPVLCELLYRWFSPKGGMILDPFAGGSVRGVVAAALERNYLGIELRREQVDANIQQRQEILAGNPFQPAWLCGDSADIATLLGNELQIAGPFADLVFSCPPYGSLEVYSDDPRDISTKTAKDFESAYRAIVKATVAFLRPDRFACFVVGNYREKNGRMIDLNGITVRAFEDAGLTFYNEIMLVTALGTTPIRTSRMFPAGRKVGRTHQNVTVFLKGDAKRACAACGPLEELGMVAGSGASAETDGGEGSNG